MSGCWAPPNELGGGGAGPADTGQVWVRYDTTHACTHAYTYTGTHTGFEANEEQLFTYQYEIHATCIPFVFLPTGRVSARIRVVCRPRVDGVEV